MLIIVFILIWILSIAGILLFFKGADNGDMLDL